MPPKKSATKLSRAVPSQSGSVQPVDFDTSDSSESSSATSSRSVNSRSPLLRDSQSAHTGGPDAEAAAAEEKALMEEMTKLHTRLCASKNPALQALAPQETCDRPRKPHDCFHIDESQRAVGTTKAAGEQHISYLIRQFELWFVHINKDTGDVVGLEYDKSHAKFEDPQNQAWLGIIGAVTFFATWIPLHLYGGLGAADTALIPLLAGVFVLYAIVYSSTGFALYQANSFVDGWNTITRFTVKLSSPTWRTTFIESNVPCSISSSVSTRGSTLNKLMIAVTFCLGCCLFIKFSQADTFWCTLIGFGYLGLTFTGMYENRQFNMDESNPPMTQQRQDRLGAQGPITLVEQMPLRTYDRYHVLGVLLFVLVTFLGQLGWWHATADPLPWQSSAWWSSFTSIVLAVTFGVLNELLSGPRSNRREESSALGWWVAGTANASTNKWRGITCISIEMLALMFATLAGLLSQPVKRCA